MVTGNGQKHHAKRGLYRKHGAAEAGQYFLQGPPFAERNVFLDDAAAPGLVGNIPLHAVPAISALEETAEQEVYIGNMVQQKQGSISYKDHRLRNKPKDEWIRVEHTHEPIIDMETWEAVRALDGPWLL